MLIAETFKALGDPVRLEIIERLSSGSLYTLSSVSKDLGLTRQGARKHLQVLADAELIKMEPTGRNTIITFAPASLKAADSFIKQLERKWDVRLEALREFAEGDKS
ncbi:MAG: HTH-type transcriptional regulator [Candidatus Saccharibacteria bacterium]|nr:HTH-type transcriptional regulator [Candidatus Saccharibacteria bacterium]